MASPPSPLAKPEVFQVSLAIERQWVKEVVRAVLGAILFQRVLGNFKPGTVDVCGVTFPVPMDPEVDAIINAHVEAFSRALDQSSSLNHPGGPKPSRMLLALYPTSKAPPPTTSSSSTTTAAPSSSSGASSGRPRFSTSVSAAAATAPLTSALGWFSASAKHLVTGTAIGATPSSSSAAAADHHDGIEADREREREREREVEREREYGRVWEGWVVQVECLREGSGSGASGVGRRTVGGGGREGGEERLRSQLNDFLLRLLVFVSTKTAHVPPITSASVQPFGVQILINPITPPFIIPKPVISTHQPGAFEKLHKTLVHPAVVRGEGWKTDTFILGIPDKSLNVTNYTFGEIELAVNLLATHYATVLSPRAKGDVETNLTVALLAPSGFDYVINELALARLGYSVLFVSINNSPAAVAHLCQETKSTHLFVAPRYLKTAEESLSFLPTGYALKLMDVAQPEVYGKEAQEASPNCHFECPLSQEEQSKLVGFIVHSSGSTGFPKPIYTTHGAFMFNIFVNFRLPGLTTLPLYHNHGHACLYRAMYSIKPLWLYPSSELPLTESNILGILDQPGVNPEAYFGVPYVYKILGESEKGIERLKQFKLCLYGGSAMPTELGNKLVAAGVRLVGHYGSTETGQLMTSFRDYLDDKEWEYNRVSPQLAPYLRMEDRGENRYESIVLDGWKGKSVTNRPDGSYAMSDLHSPHPTREGLWKFVGRTDDTLVLVNGEKVNAIPIELALKGSSTFIQDAIVFGSERAQAGVLILLSDAVDPSLSRSAILELLQPALDFANAESPTHARITPELVILLPTGTAIPRADKGSFIRRKVYAEFKGQIDKAYAAAEGEGGDEDKKKLGSVEEVEAHLLQLVGEVAGTTNGLEKDTDVFTFGLDSLAAGRIRNSLQREFDLRGHKLPLNFVFENPTVQLAAKYLVAVASGQAVTETTQIQQMEALVDKYRTFPIPPRHQSAAPSPPSLRVVVLTGVTGSLGANLLGSLLARTDVERVYCLVRAKNNGEAVRRVKSSLSEKGIPGGEDERVICLASEFSEEHLGLGKARYEEIAAAVTAVLHNAWSVNFNLQISSFEPHIRGACNFIQLCLDSTYLATFYFASSVSAVASWPGPGKVPEAVTEEPETAQDMGYARSKWVTEKLCQIASETTPARAVVLRIGQMVGAIRDGRWNETEAVSLMIKSGDVLHALPDLPENPSWLPVDSAAEIILDLATLPPPPAGTSQCWHVMQPRTIPFSSVLDGLVSAGMVFDRVPPQEWVKRLREGPQDPAKNPTIKLLTFFSNKYDHPPGQDTVVKRFPLDCTKTLEASKVLRETPLVDTEMIGKFVRCWRSTGFLVEPSK